METTGRILIIDSQNDSAKILAGKLEKNGLRSIIVNSHSGGIEYLKSHAAQVLVVLTQMRGNDESFWTFPSQIREAGVRPLPPVACYSYRSDSATVKKAIDAGYKEYIIRPVEPDILYDKILRLIQPALKHDANFHAQSFGESALASFCIQLISASETAVELRSPVAFPQMALIQIEAQGLKSESAGPVDILVRNCTRISDPPFDGWYKIMGTFIFLPSEAAREIRRRNLRLIPSRLS